MIATEGSAKGRITAVTFVANFHAFTDRRLAHIIEVFFFSFFFLASMDPMVLRVIYHGKSINYEKGLEHTLGHRYTLARRGVVANLPRLSMARMKIDGA